MFSIMTTAPSTTMPKSSAPSESRLAGMWLRSRQMEANSKREGNGDGDDDGAAHIAEEEKRMMETRMMPSVRLCSTVCVVRWTRSLRSRKGTTLHALGQNVVVELLDLLVNALSTGSASAPLRSSTSLPRRRDCR
jgi:hypothetical protein